jgi:hypothetical protein
MTKNGGLGEVIKYILALFLLLNWRLAKCQPTTKWLAMSASGINPEVPQRNKKTLSMQEELI